jgi:transcription termination factor NusB
VSINEALELAKRFSDDQGRMFINGALSTFLKKKDTLDTTQ